jgi:hypothetical protein
MLAGLVGQPRHIVGGQIHTPGRETGYRNSASIHAENRGTLELDPKQPGVLLMPSTLSASPQVIWRRFASFRVLKSSVYAGDLRFPIGFDSRQLHNRNTQLKGCFHPQIGSSPAHPEKAHYGLAIKQRCGAKARFLLKLTSR